MNKRREFLINMLVGGLAAGYGSEALASVTSPTVIPARVKILFQGDSVTDGNRSRNSDWNHVMGHGYAYTIASKLWHDFPDKGFYFYNRGVSGNQVGDLAARWQNDTIDIKPDWLSILVGINDTEAYIKGNRELTAESFENTYRKLLQQTREQLPDTKLVLGEPFILPVGRVKDRLALYESEVGKRQKIVKKLSEEFGALFIPYQSAFTKALDKASADYWIWDGIHPMPAGHELMARLWLEIAGPELGI
ncbi:lysophospholipase [Dyadobacter luteus]|jgi:lysophospholipase L1-like esterase|uniref:Lysophospholipase n=1 Tax=Dyadobacter luteus TaxID=2259619 RepID=A0A3D8YGC6_9BACT|nr:SGNH/GDSL hydrolase family protein [Dyadobacter luteus]REA63748.1 lysophospholipase [Dyadobacter luteus]